MSETWTKRAVPYGSFTYWSVVCDSRYVAQSLAESDCDRIIADHEEANALRAALSEARRLADDLTQQAYESTTQGGVFFDTLSQLRAALRPSPTGDTGEGGEG